MGASAARPANAMLPWFPEFVGGRRSIRRYLPLPVARDLVDSLLEAATAAPSAHNRQPWRFLVIESPSAKQELARVMAERLRLDRTRDGDAPEDIEADVSRSVARITGAPIVVVVCLTMADMDRYSDERRGRAEYLMAVQGTAMAAHNLLLAAHAAGLGACWMCAPLFCPDAVCSAFGLAPDWEPQAIITLGYPADRGRPFRRRPVSELTRHEDREP